MWAEVIGDPVAHSKSPAIHGFWLDCLGIQGSYKATLISEGKLGAYFEQRLRDPDWRGCNVTIPHKLAVIPFLDEASEIGAVNCVTREDGRLIGRNTDVDGFAEAIAGADLEKVVVIGAGGAARAALAGLREAGQIINITRQNIEDTTLLEGATLIVNATPLGMAHAGPMPRTLLEALPGGAARHGLPPGRPRQGSARRRRADHADRPGPPGVSPVLRRRSPPRPGRRAARPDHRRLTPARAA